MLTSPSRTHPKACTEPPSVCARKGPWSPLTLPGPGVRPEQGSPPPPGARATHPRRCSCRCCTSPSPAGSGRPASSSSPRRRGRRSPGTGWLPGPSCGSRRRRSCTCWGKGERHCRWARGLFAGDRRPHGAREPLRAGPSQERPTPPRLRNLKLGGNWKKMVAAGSS